MRKPSMKTYEVYADLMNNPDKLDKEIKSVSKARKTLSICCTVIGISQFFMTNANLGVVSIFLAILILFELKYQVLNIVKAVSKNGQNEYSSAEHPTASFNSAQAILHNRIAQINFALDCGDPHRFCHRTEPFAIGLRKQSLLWNAVILTAFAIGLSRLQQDCANKVCFGVR